VTATGTISGNTASFTFWSGSSYAASRDEDRGSGTLTLSANGNMLQGSWTNVSKKDPESGSFSAVRLSSLLGDNPANADESGPTSDEETDDVEGEPENAATRQPDSHTDTTSTTQGQHGNNAGNAASTTIAAQPMNNPETSTTFGLNVSNALTLFADALTKPVTQDGYHTLYGTAILLSDAQKIGSEQINYGSETMKAAHDLLRLMERLRDTLSDTSSQLFNGAQQMFERIHAETLDMLLEE
jgi:hypothetical protein